MGTNVVQKVDGSLSFLNEDTATEVFRVGGPSVGVGGAAATNTNVPQYRGLTYVKVRVNGPTDTAGGLAGLANPFGVTAYIQSSQLVVTTQSAGACTVSAGVAANATTLNAGLVSGQSVAAAGSFAGSGAVQWGATQFITASTATGASSGLVGFLLVGVVLA